MRSSVLFALAAAACAADPAQAAIEHLRAANAARQAEAAAIAAWRDDRARLQALIDAAAADAVRMEEAASAAERAAAASETRLAAAGDAESLAALRERQAAAGRDLAERLRALQAAMPPGTLRAPADPAFDAVAAAVDAAERAAGSVAIEVVTGRIDGEAAPIAVKLLRVAGAAMWWEALDGAAAGPAAMQDGALRLRRAADLAARDAIRLAIAISEGRSPPALVVLPEAAP